MWLVCGCALDRTCNFPLGAFGHPFIHRTTPTTIIITGNQTLQVNGTLDLSGTTISVGDSGGVPIVVNGPVILGGTITVVLSAIPLDGSLIHIINGSQITGEFDDIDVALPSGSGCRRVTGTPVLSSDGRSVSMLLNIERCDGGGLKPAVIAGIAVGAAVGFLLAAILVGLLLFRFCPSARVLFRRPARVFVRNDSSRALR